MVVYNNMNRKQYRGGSSSSTFQNPNHHSFNLDILEIIHKETMADITVILVITQEEDLPIITGSGTIGHQIVSISLNAELVVNLVILPLTVGINLIKVFNLPSKIIRS